MACVKIVHDIRTSAEILQDTPSMGSGNGREIADSGAVEISRHTKRAPSPDSTIDARQVENQQMITDQMVSYADWRIAQDRAHSKIYKAIRRGLMLPPSSFKCAHCGGAAKVYDHRDYRKPLDVTPVCELHNYRLGSALPVHYRIHNKEISLVHWGNVLLELNTIKTLGWIAQETGISRRTIQRWQNRKCVPKLCSIEALWCLHYRVFGK